MPKVETRIARATVLTAIVLTALVARGTPAVAANEALAPIPSEPQQTSATFGD